ncbi:RdgB/HAM1 family non-canonical purine NTP pyrophosphatase [Microvirga sp. W0021]|uniref:dITP/XTP pyrophosphatase n=1 Tax=Hohaiivirga grylli TaxID=3133970 RepID=A0ABV0BJB8_9HYPH
MSETKPRRLTGDIVIATHNAGKLREINEILAPFGLSAKSAADYGLPEPVENGFMFSDNAAIKAHAAAKATGLPAIADDSGLCLDALDGAPGLFTADWCGNPRNYQAAMKRVEYELNRRKATDRTAHFTSTIIVAWPDGHEELFEGRVFGQFVYPPRGEDGFGYDPCFLPDGYDKTFAEMTTAEKNGINWEATPPTGLSHRARALIAFVEGCLKGKP